jgi:hypothetical protein
MSIILKKTHTHISRKVPFCKHIAIFILLFALERSVLSYFSWQKCFYFPNTHIKILFKTPFRPGSVRDSNLVAVTEPTKERMNAQSSLRIEPAGAVATSPMDLWHLRRAFQGLLIHRRSRHCQGREVYWSSPTKQKVHPAHSLRLKHAVTITTNPRDSII